MGRLLQLFPSCSDMLVEPTRIDASLRCNKAYHPGSFCIAACTAALVVAQRGKCSASQSSCRNVKTVGGASRQEFLLVIMFMWTMINMKNGGSCDALLSRVLCWEPSLYQQC